MSSYTAVRHAGFTIIFVCAQVGCYSCYKVRLQLLHSFATFSNPKQRIVVCCGLKMGGCCVFPSNFAVSHTVFCISQMCMFSLNSGWMCMVGEGDHVPHACGIICGTLPLLLSKNWE